MSAMSGKRWLLAAEADQIQDLIFQASELRQIVGGSQILERFCNQAPALLLDRYSETGAWSQNDLVIHRGGAFRVLFDDKDQAITFGQALAEAYRQVTGGTLSRGEPVPFGSGGYHEAQAEAHRSMVTAKRGGGTPAATAQLPYAGLCASCGRGLAVAHRARPGVDDGRPDYLCADCRTKFSEAYDRPSEDDNQEPFLGRFRQAVRGQGQDWALRRPPDGDWAGAIAGHDGNRMVAYLAADGNGMGEVFGACTTPEASRALSDAMEETMRAALAGACAALLALRPEVNERKVRDPAGVREPRTGIMPLVPLIMGGDDLFALLPAPWAVDLACRVIRTWESRLAETLAGLGLDHRPTLSAALVFCKANYPHTLARQRCDRELARAKRLSHGGCDGSVLAYAVITGNQTGGGAAMMGTDRVQTTLAPFALDGPRVGALFAQRRLLDRVPRKRLHELEGLFDSAPVRLPNLRTETLRKEWLVPLDALLERIGRSQPDAQAVRAALESLGGVRDPYGWWQDLVPPPPWAEVTPVYGHGLPDLLRLWPFLERVDQREEKASC